MTLLLLNDIDSKTPYKYYISIQIENRLQNLIFFFLLKGPFPHYVEYHRKEK